MYNDFLQLTFTKPAGHIIGIQYNGIDNLLELHNPELNGGYNVLNCSSYIIIFTVASSQKKKYENYGFHFSFGVT